MSTYFESLKARQFSLQQLGFAALGGALVGWIGHRLLAGVDKPRRPGPIYKAGMIKARPEMLEQYTRLHDHTWDEVQQRMLDCNIRDFVVWLDEGSSTMFHQVEPVTNSDAHPETLNVCWCSFTTWAPRSSSKLIWTKLQRTPLLDSGGRIASRVKNRRIGTVPSLPTVAQGRTQRAKVAIGGSL